MQLSHNIQDETFSNNLAPGHRCCGQLHAFLMPCNANPSFTLLLLLHSRSPQHPQRSFVATYITVAATQVGRVPRRHTASSHISLLVPSHKYKPHTAQLPQPTHLCSPNPSSPSPSLPLVPAFSYFKRQAKNNISIPNNPLFAFYTLYKPSSHLK